MNADDLPTEAADAADAHERLKALSQLLSVKDTLIAHLLQDRDGLRAKVARLEASASAAAAQAPQQLGLEDDAAAAAEAGRLQQQLRRQARETLLATLASKSGSVDRGVGPDA